MNAHRSLNINADRSVKRGGCWGFPRPGKVIGAAIPVGDIVTESRQRLTTPYLFNSAEKSERPFHTDA